MTKACSSEVVKFNMIGIQPQKGANKININNPKQEKWVTNVIRVEFFNW